MVNAIFWGIYPPADDSPHSLITKYLGLNYKPGKITHLIIGTFFYIIGVLNSSTTIHTTFLVLVSINIKSLTTPTRSIRIRVCKNKIYFPIVSSNQSIVVPSK